MSKLIEKAPIKFNVMLTDKEERLMYHLIRRSQFDLGSLIASLRSSYEDKKKDLNKMDKQGKKRTMEDLNDLAQLINRLNELYEEREV